VLALVVSPVVVVPGVGPVLVLVPGVPVVTVVVGLLSLSLTLPEFDDPELVTVVPVPGPLLASVDVCGVVVVDPPVLSLVLAPPPQATSMNTSIWAGRCMGYLASDLDPTGATRRLLGRPTQRRIHLVVHSSPTTRREPVSSRRSSGLQRSMSLRSRRA